MKRLFLSLCLLFVLCVGAKAEKLVCLSFDDGPHRKYTKEILEILKEYNVPATFFIIGKNAEENPDLLKEIASSGHEIGNHTFSHAFLDKLSEAEIKKEIEKTDDVIFDILGKSTTVFRPPGGRQNATVLKVAESLSKSVVLWSKDTRDWSCPSVEKVISDATSDLDDGDIILFHDYNARNSPTPEALRCIIPSLLDAGYKFVTASELISR